MNSNPSEFVIFYSWQSDLPDSTNRQAIRSGLRVASNKLESDNPALRVLIDETTRGVPGSPNIPSTILEKIRSCDVFVCDITTINAPVEFRRVPNPNVAFELGYAVAHIGWSRIVMVFNESFGSVKEAPFDFDRHRITPYKVSAADHKNKGSHAKLAADLGLALASIAENRPPKPISGPAQSPEQIRRSRDIANLKWVFSNVHLPTLDQMIEDLPKFISSRALHFWKGFNAVVKNSLFHLYDSVLLDTVKSMHDAWSICVSHGSHYHTGVNPSLSVFGSPGRASQTMREERAWDAINKARKQLAKAEKKLIGEVRERYLEVDIEETNRAAWQEYTEFQRTMEAQFAGAIEITR